MSSNRSLNYLGPISATALLVMVAGCTAPGQYSRQNDLLETPKQWQTQQIDQDSDEAEVMAKAGWLAQFTDPQLQPLLNQALVNNGDYLVARLRSDIAALSVDNESSAFWPQLDLILGGQKDHGITSSSPNKKVSTKTYDVGLSSSWEIDIWGRNRALVLASELDYQRTLQLEMSAKLSLSGSVTKAWFNLLALNHQQQIDQARVANLKRTTASIKQQVERGLVQRLDLDSSRSELAYSQTQLDNSTRQFQVQQQELLALVGQYQLDGIDVNAELPQLISTWYLDASVDTLLSRPDLSAAFVAIEQADASAAAAYKSRFPQLTLTASIGRSAGSAGDLNDSLFSVSSFAGNLVMPIFDAGALASQQQIREKEAMIAAVEFRQRLVNAVAEVEQGIVSEQQLWQQYDAAEDAVYWAKKAADSAMSSYKRGLIDVQFLLQSRRTVFDYQNALIEIHKNILVNRVNLHLALGTSVNAPAETQTESLTPQQTNAETVTERADT